MPKFLKDKCTKKHDVDEKLRDTFRRFKDIRKSVELEHYESKYVEVFEKDMMCGKHIFRLKPVSTCWQARGRAIIALQVSCLGCFVYHFWDLPSFLVITLSCYPLLPPSTLFYARKKALFPMAFFRSINHWGIKLMGKKFFILACVS